MTYGPFLVGDQPMPHSPDMEEALISCLLQDPQHCGSALELEEDAFYMPVCRRIFRAMKEISQTFPLFDMIMVADNLDKNGMLQDIGGLPKMREVYSSIPTVVNFERYLEAVNDNWLRRKVIAICCDATGSGYEQVTPTYEIIGNVSSKILDIDAKNGSRKPQELSQTTNDAITRLAGVYNRDQAALGVSTGFSGIDHFLGGLKPGGMYVIAARASIGKTALAINMLYNIAASGNHATYFGLEMLNEEITTRLLHQQSQIAFRDLYNQMLPWSEIEPRLTEAKRQLDLMPLLLDDAGGYWEAIQHRMRVAVHRHGSKVLCLDYLQQVNLQNSRGYQTRENQVAFISQQIKKTAQDLRVPIVVLAQLNRAAEGRTPSISDLRESGAIEQDADAVLLLNRKRESEDPETADLVRQGLPVPSELKVGKNRGGATGICPLNWFAQFTRYTDKSRIDDEDVPM